MISFSLWTKAVTLLLKSSIMIIYNKITVKLNLLSSNCNSYREINNQCSQLVNSNLQRTLNSFLFYGSQKKKKELDYNRLIVGLPSQGL